MTCKNCNAPLEEQAHFCVRCGASVADSQPRISQMKPQDATQIAPQPKRIDNPIRPPKRPIPVRPKQDDAHEPPYNAPTVPFEMPRVRHAELVEAEEPERGEIKRALSSPEQPQPLLYYQLNTTAKGSHKLPAVVNRTGYNRRRRRGCLGCILSGLSTVIVLLLIVGALWVFALRPYAHNMAQRELDSALTSAINQLPAQTKQLPAGSVIPVNENTINNLIVLNLAPSNPVQHPTTSINGQNIRLDFQLYNFPCAVTMVPALDNGRLVVNKVGVEGIFSAIMSPEEMTGILNRHLNDAQSKLQRTINNVQLKDHEVDLTLG